MFPKSAWVFRNRHPLPTLPHQDSPMHISEGGTGIAEGFEPGEPVAHGDGPGRTFRGVPFPATQASDDPACPGQGTAGMRVLLLGGTPFEDGRLEAEGFDLVGG